MTTGRKTDYTVAHVRLPREAHGLPVQTHTPSSILVMPSCRAAPCHATPAASKPPGAASGGQRPAANSARHTTRSRELGPTILACPLVKIQERALQGKHKLGYHGMGLPVPLTSRSESCCTPAVPPRYAGQVPPAAALLPTWAPTGKRRAVGQAPAQRALPADHHLSHLGRGHGDDDVNEMAGATSCTPPIHTLAHTHTPRPPRPP